MSLAPLARRALEVTGVEQLGAYSVIRAADPAGPAAGAGQFAMLAAQERWGGGEDERPFLPRACSYARFRDGESHFLIEDVGPGTKRLCELQRGERLLVLGPLGRGFRGPPPDMRAVLVGGGVGIAPLAILEDSLERPANVLLGFRDRSRAAGAALLSEGARVVTDDGSVGRQGLVTEMLLEELQRDPRAIVYACGPPGMLEGVRGICERLEVSAQLALEAGMACGFGACYGCAVPRRGGGYLRVCVDGPVIEASDLEHVDVHAGSPA